MNTARCLAAAAALCVLTTAAPAHAQVYTIATNPQGSLFYTAAAGLAKIANDKLNLQMRVQPLAGSSTYLPLLGRNELEFGFINVDDADTGYRGADAFEGKPNPNLRLLGVIFPLPFSMVVPADSPAKQIADIKGLRLPADFPGQTTARKLHEGVLATAGLTYADVKPVPTQSLFAGVDAMAAGRTDAAGTAPGIAQVQQAHLTLSSRGGVRFISISDAPDAIARMQKVMNSYPLKVAPAKHLPGVLEPLVTMGYSAFLVTNDRVPDKLVYDFTKMIHGSRAEIIATVPQLERFDPQKMAEKHVVPYHPGAIKFYSEVGQWPPKS
jgi:TRAP transporter TAXI family solute receptor